LWNEKNSGCKVSVLYTTILTVLIWAREENYRWRKSAALATMDSRDHSTMWTMDILGNAG